MPQMFPMPMMVLLTAIMILSMLSVIRVWYLILMKSFKPAQCTMSSTNKYLYSLNW